MPVLMRGTDPVSVPVEAKEDAWESRPAPPAGGEGCFFACPEIDRIGTGIGFTEAFSIARSDFPGSRHLRLDGHLLQKIHVIQGHAGAADDSGQGVLRHGDGQSRFLLEKEI